MTAGQAATAQRIRRYLKGLVRDVKTDEQYRAALLRAMRYYGRLRREDRRVMLAELLRCTLRHYYEKNRRKQ